MAPDIPEDDPTSIGNILISMGVITQDTLVQLIQEFVKHKDELLGQFLIKHAKISPEQVDLALLKQAQMRNGGADSAMLIKAIEVSKRSQQKLYSKMERLVSSTTIKSDVK